jgi:FkbM family methyltransferase
MAEELSKMQDRLAKFISRKLGLEIRRARISDNSVPFPAVSSGNNQMPAADRLTRAAENTLSWPKRPVAFVLVSSNHGTMIVNRNDYQMTEHGDGFGVGFQILTRSSYDESEVNYLLALLSNRRRFYGDGVVGIDCGANCGVHTVEWSRHMFGWGSVIAIEAQEKVYYALCGNVAINNCLNAKVILAAAGSEPREILVPCPDYLQPASFGSLEMRKSKSNEFIGQKIDYREENCVKVQQITIDQLKLNRLDLLKIDVEGMEADVLAGAETTMKNHKPQLVIEWIKSDASSIIATLEGWGYRHYTVGDNIVAIHETDASGANIHADGGMFTIS